MLFCHADLENSREQERWVKPLWWWIWRFFFFAAPVGQGLSGRPGWLPIALLGFGSGRPLATGTAWAGLCLIHHQPGLNQRDRANTRDFWMPNTRQAGPKKIDDRGFACSRRVVRSRSPPCRDFAAVPAPLIWLAPLALFQSDRWPQYPPPPRRPSSAQSWPDSSHSVAITTTRRLSRYVARLWG